MLNIGKTQLKCYDIFIHLINSKQEAIECVCVGSNFEYLRDMYNKMYGQYSTAELIESKMRVSFKEEM